MTPKTDLSLIIVNYNTKSLLRDCLQSVAKAARFAKNLVIETIVVDNASRDSSSAMVKKEFPWVKLIVSRKNLGFSGGNNLGLKKAKGKYLLFLNSDTQIYFKSLSRMVKFMEKNPAVGAATPKTLLANGQMDPDCHRGFPTPWASLTYFLGLEKLFPQSRLFGQYHQFYLNLNRHHEIDAGFGTFMIVRQKVIDQVGAWDEDYFFYGEDLDFFYRIKQAGWKVMFYARPLLKHYKGASSGLRKESKGITQADRPTRLKTAKASIKAMEIFYQKFYQDKYPRLLTLLILSGIKLKGFFRILGHYLRP